MSPMGRLAARAREEIKTKTATTTGVAAGRAAAAPSPDPEDNELCVNVPDCEAGLRDGPAGGQAELSIAVDHTGKNVVIGFNDTRGFALSVISVSGFMYSSDGGKTFTDGGQLPVTTGLDAWIFGDPEVKYLGGCTFVYSSILLTFDPEGRGTQTVGVHRSADCGHTWEGPYEVQAATNPNGQVDPDGFAVDAADKEFMDVDPETGRLMMTWSNFTPTAVEIRSAISDDGGLTWPAAKGRVISSVEADGQASIPRFAPGSAEVYVAWQRFPFPGTFFGLGNTIAFARSLDNGNTWQPPIELSPEFFTMDHVLGDDRVNNSPSLAVDRSGGRRDGTIYVVYANNNNQDGADIVFQKSANGGVSFSAPILLNSRPGSDRAQWFPWVTVDENTGRVSVFYYDQGIAASGHVSEVTYTFSNDGGSTWKAPRPLTARPFKAGHGNDTGQPNLGDYNQAVAAGGTLWAAYAHASRPPLGFADGQPESFDMTVPDAEVRIVSAIEHLVPRAPVDLAGAVSTVSGANAYPDPGETVSLRLRLRNYVTNPLNKQTVRLPLGILTTSTPGVTIVNPASLYFAIAPGESRENITPFRLKLSPDFVAGTSVELELHVISVDGLALLRHTLFTGTPVETDLIAENFDAVAPGAMAPGWIRAHGAGFNTVRWTTTNTFCGGSNGAFHQNANDGPPGRPPVRWERLASPLFNVPDNSDHVVVEFDVCYDTEDDPNFNVLAYDGMFLNLIDYTPGRTTRLVLAEAFEDEFTTGPIQHYPRHLPRSSHPFYFEDMSVWAGASEGLKHVRLRLPGMAGSTARIVFEFTQDSFATCQDVRPGSAACGVFVDNISVRSVEALKK
jgi:hypothetical protein